jgi:hypothetical protein
MEIGEITGDTSLNSMKLRFLAMGSIISILSLALLASRGIEISYVGLLGVGILLFVVGLLWKRGEQNPVRP